MTIRRKACIVGAYEHPTRKAPDKTIAQLHAECARGALADAGLTLSDVDGYFCAGDAPGLGANNMVDYLGLKVRHVDSTDTGGSAYLVAQAIKKSRVVGFEDLGMEAIYEFEVEDMPVTVAVDSQGTSVHQTGPAKWKEIIAQKA